MRLQSCDEHPEWICRDDIERPGQCSDRQRGCAAQTRPLAPLQHCVSEEGVDAIIQQVADAQRDTRRAETRVQAARAFRVRQVKQSWHHGSRQGGHMRRGSGEGSHTCWCRRLSLTSSCTQERSRKTRRAEQNMGCVNLRMLSTRRAEHVL